jgi:hypothetical protein
MVCRRATRLSTLFTFVDIERCSQKTMFIAVLPLPFLKKNKMLKCLLVLCALVFAVQSAEYLGNANGGLNLLTWFGEQRITGKVYRISNHLPYPECQRGEENVGGGVSSGTDLTFGRCYNADDFGLNGDRSDEDNDAWFMITTTNDNFDDMTVRVYESSTCSGTPLWEVTNVKEELCACDDTIFEGCFKISIPLWDASIWKDVQECSGNPDDYVKNLMKNKCYDGTSQGVGWYMLWTFQCSDGDYGTSGCGRYEAGTGVRHQLVYQCDESCLSAECLNTWTVRPTDCKCDEERDGCILADFTTDAPTLVSIVLYVAPILLLLLQ